MTVTLRSISYSDFRRELPKKTRAADLVCYFCLETLKNQKLVGHQGRGWTRHVIHKKCVQGYIDFLLKQGRVSIKCNFCYLEIQNARDYLPPVPWTEKIRQFFIQHEILGGALTAGIPVLGNRLIAEMVLRLNISESEDDLTHLIIAWTVAPLFAGLCTAKLSTWLKSAVAKNQSSFLTGFLPTIIIPQSYSYLTFLWGEKRNEYLAATYSSTMGAAGIVFMRT